MKRTFLFATIASILSINAYAVSATVTSKDYVDTTRQATIPASGTNALTPGDTVVTYTSTAGTIGERGICDAEADGDCGDNFLVTRDLLERATDLTTTTVTYKTCTEWVANAPQTDANCLLWQLSDRDVYGKCTSDSECEWLDDQCPDGFVGVCKTSSGKCYCSGGK